MQKPSESQEEKKDSPVTNLKLSPKSRSLSLLPFTHDKIPMDAFIIVYGKRRYGKTTWTRYSLSKRWKYFPDGGYVFTQTKHNYYWQQHFPESRIYNGVQTEVLDMIIKKQMNKWRKISNDEPVKQPPHIVLVFEDVMGDAKIKDHIIDKLAGLARHYYCCIYILVQDPKIVTPKVRQNADIAAFTYQTMDRTIESIYEDYAGIIGDKWVFRDMLNSHTQDHKLVVVDQTEAKYKPEDMFYQDSPKLEVKPFKIGDTDFWNESNCNWEEQLEKFEKLPPNDTKYWKKLLKVRWKEDNSKQEEEHLEDKVLTNQPALGGPEVYDEHAKNLKQKYKLESSATKEASELLSKIFHYRNGLSIHE